MFLCTKVQPRGSRGCEGKIHLEPVGSKEHRKEARRGVGATRHAPTTGAFVLKTVLVGKGRKIGGLGEKGRLGRFPPKLLPHVPSANENLDTDCSSLVGGGCFLFLNSRLYLSIMQVKLLGSTLHLKRSVENLTRIMTK